MADCLHCSVFRYKEIIYEGERPENLRKSTDIHNRSGFSSMETANLGTVYISFGGFFRAYPFKNYMLVESSKTIDFI